MPKITIIFGLLLCALSAFVAGVLFSRGEFKMGTWLIPTGFGIPLLVLGGLAAANTPARKHYMHAAVSIGLIGGLIALFRGIPSLINFAQGKEVNWLAVGMVWAMTVLCFAFVALCVRSFIAARKAREKSELANS